jgi:hypothetical protein
MLIQTAMQKKDYPKTPPPTCQQGYSNLYLQSLARQGMSPLDLLKMMPPEMPTERGKEGMRPRDEESSYWDLYDDVDGM